TFFSGPIMATPAVSPCHPTTYFCVVAFPGHHVLSVFPGGFAAAKDDYRAEMKNSFPRHSSCHPITGKFGENFEFPRPVNPVATLYNLGTMTND
ncbi:MAG: hypothetical protein K8S55_09330, partial [Phycisphaerae bacterium]|nr:hypothetical protein [Phycisphaerae bacterium]